MIKAFFFLFYSEKCPKYKKINPILYFFQQKGLKFEICSLFLMCFHPKTGFRSFFVFCCSIFSVSFLRFRCLFLRNPTFSEGYVSFLRFLCLFLRFAIFKAFSPLRFDPPLPGFIFLHMVRQHNRCLNTNQSQMPDYKDHWQEYRDQYFYAKAIRERIFRLQPRKHPYLYL